MKKTLLVLLAISIFACKKEEKPVKDCQDCKDKQKEFVICTGNNWVNNTKVESIYDLSKGEVEFTNACGARDTFILRHTFHPTGVNCRCANKEEVEVYQKSN